MPAVSLQTVSPRMLAAIRREVAPGRVGTAWRPALDLVWAFLKTRPGLRTDGRNAFLYEHPRSRGAPIICWFGVEVTRAFEPSGEAGPVETPAGDAAVAVHVGGYDRLHQAHYARALYDSRPDRRRPA